MEQNVTTSAMSLSLLARNVYCVCFTDRDSRDALRGELAQAREKFFSGNRKTVRVGSRERIRGFEGKLQGKLSRRSFFWRKSAAHVAGQSRLMLEEAFDQRGGYVLVKRDFRGVIASRVFFDKTLLWLKSEYYEPWDSQSARVTFKPVDADDRIERFDWDAAKMRSRSTMLYPVPYQEGTAEQNLLNARFGEPRLLVSTKEGVYCYCPEKEAQARKAAAENLKGGTLVILPAWEVKEGSLTVEEDPDQADISFPSLEEYALIQPRSSTSLPQTEVSSLVAPAPAEETQKAAENTSAATPAALTPAEEAQQAAENTPAATPAAPAPAEEAQQTTESNSSSTPAAPAPAEEGQQPAENTSAPTPAAPAPAEEVQQAAENTPAATPAAPAPAEEAQQTTESNSSSTPAAPAPAEEAQQTTESSSPATPAAPAPAEEVQLAAENTSAATPAAPVPAEEAQQAAENSSSSVPTGNEAPGAPADTQKEETPQEFSVERILQAARELAAKEPSKPLHLHDPEDPVSRAILYAAREAAKAWQEQAAPQKKESTDQTESPVQESQSAPAVPPAPAASQLTAPAQEAEVREPAVESPAKEEIPAVHGRTQQPSGLTVYEGQFREGRRDGFGVAFYKDGTPSYTGSWKEGKRDGLGVSFRDSDHAVHIAHWKNGAPEDFVSLFDKEGNLRYGGRIEKGKKQGPGVSYNTADGTVFVGKWVDGRPTGVGSAFDREGNLVYYGEWKNGQRSGHGTQFDSAGGIVFDGEWKDGKYYNGILYQKLEDPLGEEQQ
ncbi:MAG: MORN repeat-containing protein [Acutalibacter sp.]|jgi:antitoxin component YwqK of YwqJK toxin-antitoxin module